jgi:predicted enzyme related to lactoylglutathione lyase
MKEILGLRTVAYRVPNLAEAKEWYSKAFKQEPYFDEPYYVGFNIGGYELGLQPFEEGHNVNGNTVTAYWGVEDVELALKHFIENGAKEHEPPMEVGVIVASVKDPWGNIIGLIYNPHFKLPE